MATTNGRRATTARLPRQKDVPLKRFAPILERELARRGGTSNNGGADDRRALEQLASQIAASGVMSREAAMRRIHQLRNPRYRSKSGKMVTQKVVTFELVDGFLSALDLTDLWQSELADLYGGRNGTPSDHWCPECEEWTLDKVCGWCDSRTMPAERLLEHKRKGTCEVCRRKVRGLIEGHRLCDRHRRLTRKLGPTIEERLGLEQPKQRKRKDWNHPLLPREKVEQLHVLYTRLKIGTPTVAAMTWKQLGFDDVKQADNAIRNAFERLGLPMRSRADSHVRNERTYEQFGFGGRGLLDKRMTVRDVDELWQLYEAGESAHAIAKRLYRKFGYERWQPFRHAFEYAWKVRGYKLRSPREATLLAKQRAERLCKGTTTGANGCRPRPCTQLPLKGSDYCLHHDPDHAEEVRARAAKLRARKPEEPKIEWELLEPALAPLLVPRLDPHLSRPLEKAGGALARNTGVSAAMCSRMVNHRTPVTHKMANRLLAPLNLTVDDVLEQRWKRAA